MAEARQPAWLRIAVPLALAVLVAVGLWRLRGASEPEAPPEVEAGPKPDDAPPRLAGPEAPPEAEGAPPAEVAEEPPPEPEEEPEASGEVVPLATVVATADGRVLEAVRPCWEEVGASVASHQRMILRYELVVEHGEAFARGATVMDDRIQVEGLVSCVLERVGDASWPVPGAPDITRVMQVSLSAADLTP